MSKKLLWTTDFRDKKLEVEQSEYDITQNNIGINVTKNNGGWLYMPKDFCDRIYGDTAQDVVSNRRKWLIETILPRKMKELTDVTDEIEAMNNWINDNA